jgi:hypothetical protein
MRATTLTSPSNSANADRRPSQSIFTFSPRPAPRRSGQKREVKLTRPGWEAACDLVERLAGARVTGSSFGLQVQQLTRLTDRVLVLGKVAGDRAEGGWFAPVDVTRLLEAWPSTYQGEQRSRAPS